MWSEILSSVSREQDGWIAQSYGRHGVIAIGTGDSEPTSIRHLHRALDEFFEVVVFPWLKSLQHAGSEETPNCPEGTVKLPIDLWYCKLAETACPIQAQVFLGDRAAFFDGCLAEEGRKEAIYRAVEGGKYGGFHHVVGRGPCSHCELTRGSDRSLTYFYPWELSCLKDFAPFVPERDMEKVVRAASRNGVRRPSVLNPLCAKHSLEVAEFLYPEIASRLRVVRRDYNRPVPKVPNGETDA